MASEAREEREFQVSRYVLHFCYSNKIPMLNCPIFFCLFLFV